MATVLAALAIPALLIWIYLILFRGRFWLANQKLRDDAEEPGAWPAVVALVPARNEADVIKQTLDTLLMQDYPGPFHVILIDDESTDGTAHQAKLAAREAGGEKSFTVVRAGEPPAGWSGKVWALAQGWAHARQTFPDARYVWLSDADISHWLGNLRQLVSKAEDDKLDLVSLMAMLSCESPWERFLIPPFVFFFQKLYPFPWVNNSARATAAAGGGCVLLRADALEAAGGFAAIKGALIDDCALAGLIKARAVERDRGIWLGLGEEAESIRPYEGLKPIWDMVTRSAYTQLNHSPLLLLGTLLGMVFTYLVPPAAVLGGLFAGFFLDESVAAYAALALLAGCAASGLMALAAWPTYRLYGEPPWMIATLPLAGLLYAVMTLDSACRHWMGRGGRWKGRIGATKARATTGLEESLADH